MSLEDKFRKAAEDIKKLKQKPNEDELLTIYALYKQAELGDCNIQRVPKQRSYVFLLKFKLGINKFILAVQKALVFTARPGLLDFTGKAKWDAWNSKKGVSQDTAKEEYISRCDELVQKYGICN